MRNILLVIDIQKEFKDKTGEKYKKVINYINNNKDNYDLIIGTFFKNEYPSNFDKKLHWDGCKNASVDSVEYNYNYLCKKSTYIFDIDNLFSKNDKITLIGCDTDACIFVNAANLFDKGYDFRILTDYIYSTSNFDENVTINILKRNFGDCVV